uniref:hypothetical protein n=1 Tax=Rhodohalobacter halophilus TaxID=1812810 RepID=UPI001FE23EA0|nr:hypothetical protein [Rhodohalobacter halophilus]
MPTRGRYANEYRPEAAQWTLERSGYWRGEPRGDLPMDLAREGQQGPYHRRALQTP